MRLTVECTDAGDAEVGLAIRAGIDASPTLNGHDHRKL